MNKSSQLSKASKFRKSEPYAVFRVGAEERVHAACIPSWMTPSVLRDHGGMAPAKPPRDDDPHLVIQPRPYDHPDVRSLVDDLYLEQVGRYGFADAPNEDPTDFAPPLGVFLVAYADGIPCACGGMRAYRPGVAEIKKMYVTPTHRGRGLGRRILDNLEQAAHAASARRIILETGSRNTEALSLYIRAGHRAIPAYRERDATINRALAKDLIDGRVERRYPGKSDVSGRAFQLGVDDMRCS